MPGKSSVAELYPSPEQHLLNNERKKDYCPRILLTVKLNFRKTTTTIKPKPHNLQQRRVKNICYY